MDNSDPPPVLAVLRAWEDENQNPNYDPVPMLTMLAEIVEAEIETYMKMDPDPFDERHPSRAYPTCSLGHTLKILFRKESFMNKLVNDYLRDTYYSRLNIQGRDVRALNIAACRLMLAVTPGLETAAVFEMPTNDTLLQRLFSWAEKASDPLQTYATGLLAAAMEVQEIAVMFKEQNSRLVPIMLERLHNLLAEKVDERFNQNGNRPFAEFGKADIEASPNGKRHFSDKNFKKNSLKSPSLKLELDECGNATDAKLANGYIKAEDTIERRRNSEEGLTSPPLKPSPFGVSDASNSSWAEMEPFLIGNIQMHPLNLATKQIFILKYLTPMGEYQEYLSHVFEKNALEIILQLMNLRETRNSRLSFEALRYLASLLCHKKFSIEFINVNGLQKMLAVPRPSIAATGVSICLYYLAYCEDAMERVCLSPPIVVSELVSYALWLLECSHDSGRCHATMFFGLSFQFRAILEEFDAQDGLRKLYNVISTLPILSYNEENYTEDEECSARQIVRHVCVALKRYLEAHLYIKAQQVKRANTRDLVSISELPVIPSYKAFKPSPEEVRECINTLLECLSFRAPWAPVDNLVRLGGVTLLLQIIAFAYEWNYAGRGLSNRGETVRSALDVLCICATMPRVQLLLCEKVELPDDVGNTLGVNVILSAAEGDIVADPDVQRAALHVLITCVCAPIHRVGGSVSRFSFAGGPNKKKSHTLKSSEEAIEKLWECVRKTNGIMVLLGLITMKTPITDADSIRRLACQALAGLARSETVRQIISKLPLFSTGQLQSLMKDPILQDRRQEHVLFQKYALELLEHVSGKKKPYGAEVETSLSNIHRANIIAQTRIQFNSTELLQLIQQHLLAHGLSETAMILQKEAGLPPPPKPQQPAFLSPFTYGQRTITTPNRLRPIKTSEGVHNTPPPTSVPTTPKATPNPNQPIRLCLSSSSAKKADVKCPSTPSSRMEKQIPYEKGSNPLIPEPKEIPSVSLDSIITEYLMNQHSLCKNPMVTCPQFTIFRPHKCPDRRIRSMPCTNFVMRHSNGYKNQKAKRLDHKLIYSRYSPVHTFRYGEDSAFFTACDFILEDKYIVIGTQHGEVKLFSLHSGSETTSHGCHESYISNIMCSRNKPLLLTSSTWRTPLSAVWSVKDNMFRIMASMDEEEYVEFGKLNEDRIIGTKGEIATIYDTNTGQLVSTLTPSLSNQYIKNKATFCPTDELVLSDGVLWDVNSGKEIHKFDKLNQTVSGVFHPNGLEIVSNTEVWDLRTFHLLKTVPVLDQCEVTFTGAAPVLFSTTMEREGDDDSAYDSSFTALDSNDYSSIATIDVRRNICKLSCNRRGTQLALVENQGGYDSIQESVVKIYDIGRSKNNGDEPSSLQEDEDEDDDMDGSEGSNSDDDANNDSTFPSLEIFDEVSDNDQRDNSNTSTSDDDDDDDDDDDEDDDDNDDLGEITLNSESSDEDFF